MKFQHILFVLLVSASLTACEKNETPEPVRLFRPPSGQLSTLNNTIVVNWQDIKGAASYILQVSRDTFRTIDYSFNLDTNAFVVPNLRWNQLYQLQVKAIAEDTSLNSGWSSLGGIKIPKFAAWIHEEPTSNQSTDEAIKVNWRSGGDAVTSIKVLKASDSSLVKEVPLDNTDNTNKYKIISGLSGSTSYVVFLYSGTTDRGWENYTTKTPLAGTLIDLRNITGRPSVLSDTIPSIPSGSIVLLKRGNTYNISSSVSLSKSIMITNGDDLLVPEPATLFFTSNFNFVAGSTIDSIVFKGLTLRSDNYGSRYVFNTTNGATVGSMKFLNSRIEIFRGIVRLQSGATTVNNFIVDNCILDSLSNYGVLTVDNISCKTDNISITNSTIYKAEKVITSTKQTAGSVSVRLENCTLNETVTGTNAYIDYGSTNVSAGITVANCIFGVAKAGGTVIRDIKAGTSTSVNASNNYRTSDYISAGSANDLPNVMTYTKPSTQLWQDPVNGNFKIIDNAFPGKANSGDPRWRP